MHYIEEHTSDFGSILDLIFANCQSFFAVIESYWTDHKLVYCALETEILDKKKIYNLKLQITCIKRLYSQIII